MNDAQTQLYLALSIFERYNTKLPTRRYFVSRIKAVCEKLGYTREELGIVAKPRASMYFNGEWSSVSYDAIEELAKNGTDIIFIEKKGVAEVLCEYADNYGIALVDTQGFLTDYAKDLVEAGGVSGANVAIVSDYDASGIKLAYDAGDIPRLGVDQDMLNYFGLDRYDSRLAVKNTAERDVMSAIEDLVSEDVYEFLKHKKIEIDAVLAIVGNERFWDYLIMKLEEHYPTRNYTRVIDTKPDVKSYYPDVINRFESTFDGYVNLILEDEKSTIEGELEQVEGFIEDISEKRREISERYKTIVDKDEILKTLYEKLATEIQPYIDKLKTTVTELKDKKAQQMKEEEVKEQQRIELTRRQVRQKKLELIRKYNDTCSKHNLEIQDIEGVGPTTARKLKEAGIVSVIDLATADVDELAIDIYSSKDTAEMFIKAANKLLLEGTQQAKDDE